MFKTPILFLIFNRPETTEKVFNEIRNQKPKYLYIAADGPRQNNKADIDLCNKARTVIEKVDWDCKLKTLFRHENLGCGRSVSTAITWFFENVDEGIILEDDCIPNHSFFTFCENLLVKYRSATSLMMICGVSYQPKPLNTDAYYFSKYPHVWGWATWKRAWNAYNFKLEVETEIISVIDKTFSNRREKKLWNYNMKLIADGFDTWDYQWMYWIWKNDALCIIPWKNMIANVGFGPDATHTFDSSSTQSIMVQHDISKISHPERIILNKKADRYERFSILLSPKHKYFQTKIKNALKYFIRYFKSRHGS
jgi:GT2 family glycosyltransferase